VPPGCFEAQEEVLQVLVLKVEAWDLEFFASVSGALPITRIIAAKDAYILDISLLQRCGT